MIFLPAATAIGDLSTAPQPGQANVMGGMGTLVGPVAGAAFFFLLREGFSRYFTQYYLIPVGLIFVAMVIFLPQGLLGFARRALR